MEQSIIYVLAASGQPLMPTKNQQKVWYWLRKGLAKVVRREPFTVQLRFETSSYTQPVTVGVDTGSKTVGIAATTNGEVVYQAEVQLRDDITDKMIQRQQYRCTRRGRKTRYRPARWANRRRPNGWLPHSEHKCWAPRKVHGFKLYELIKAKGQVGYIAGRREKGAFVIKDVTSGKKLAEITPRKLVRVERPTRSWMITHLSALDTSRKEGGASSPRGPGGTRAAGIMERRRRWIAW